MSSSALNMTPHYASYARELLEEEFGEDRVMKNETNAQFNTISMCVEGLFSVSVDGTGEYTIFISRQIGQAAAFSGSFLDLLINRVCKEYPEINAHRLERDEPF